MSVFALFFRHYFVSSPHVLSNPGEQFYMFSVIAAWLISLCGRPFDTPQEYDDPNATVSNILSELRALVRRDDDTLTSVRSIWVFLVITVYLFFVGRPG